MDSTSKKTREELRKKLRQKIRQNKNQRSAKSVRSHRINQLKEKGNNKSSVEQDELMQHIYKNAAKGAKNQNEMIQNVFQQMNKLGINMDNNVDKKNVPNLTQQKITEVEPQKVDTADLINQGMEQVFTVKDIEKQKLEVADAEKESKVAFENLEKIRREIAMSKNK